MQNIKVNLRYILRKNEAGITLKFLQQFGIYAPLEKRNNDFFIDIPEGLVPEPKETEEDPIFSNRRNKSGLSPKHYKILHNQCPKMSEDEREILRLNKYRRMFGEYGNAWEIDLKVLWPSEEELKMKKAREEVEFPHSVHEMISFAKEKRLQEEKETRERQKQIVENMKQLEKWKKDVLSRMEKKDEEAKRLLDVKEKQMEEVREILGYKISPHDPKFQEILEKKMEEDKRRAKKEKKLRRQQMELDELRNMAQDAAAAIEPEKKSSEASPQQDKKDVK